MRKALPPLLKKGIELVEIKLAGKSEFRDSKLIIVDEQQFGDSTLYVYALLADILSGNTEATVLTQFNAETFGKDGVSISSFDVADASTPNERILFISNGTDNIVAMTVATQNYQIIDDKAVESVYEFDLLQMIQEQQLFILQTTELLNIRILQNLTSLGADNKTHYKFRVILITNETAVYEFLFDFVPQGTKGVLVNFGAPILTTVTD